MESRFIYDASAVAFAAQIESPFEKVIKAQAPSALPDTGGYSSSRVEHFRFEEIFSFSAAYTQVVGVESRKRANTYSTLVTAVVENLNVLDMVTADRIVMRLTSEYPAPVDPPPAGQPPTPPTFPGENSISVLGSTFVNLRIAGCPVQVNLDTDTFSNLDTLTKLRTKYQNDQAFRTDLKSRMRMNPVANAEFLNESSWMALDEGPNNGIPESNGRVLVSLVKGTSSPCPDLTTFGHVIHIPEFGTIYLAELFISRESRRLTMLRIKLGCATTGTASMSSGDGGGSPYLIRR